MGNKPSRALRFVTGLRNKRATLQQITNHGMPEKIGFLKVSKSRFEGYTKAYVMLYGNLLLIFLTSRHGSTYKLDILIDLSDPNCKLELGNWVPEASVRAPPTRLFWSIQYKAARLSASKYVQFISDPLTSDSPVASGSSWVLAIRERMGCSRRTTQHPTLFTKQMKRSVMIRSSLTKFRYTARRSRNLSSRMNRKVPTNRHQSENTVLNYGGQFQSLFSNVSESHQQPCSNNSKGPVEVVQEAQVMQLLSKLSDDERQAFELCQQEIVDILHVSNWDVELAHKNIIQVKHTNNQLEEEEDSVGACGVCFSPLSRTERRALACGHPYCNNCWAGLLSVKVSEGRSCLKVSCMHPKCTQLVPPSWYDQLLSSDEVARYHRLATKQFVETQKQLKWCPNVFCDGVLGSVSPCGSKQVSVNCPDCHEQFCFRCTQPVHGNMSCFHAVSWAEAKEKVQEASGMSQVSHRAQERARAKAWILKHTKPCPGCKSPIQKTQGCNHMTCAECSFEFCWECYTEWSDHGTETVNYFRCSISRERKAAAKIRETELSLRGTEYEEFDKLHQQALAERVACREADTVYRRAMEHVARFEYYNKLVERFDSPIEDKVSKGLEVLESHCEGAPGLALHFRAFIQDARFRLKWSYIIAFYWQQPGSSVCAWVSHSQLVNMDECSILDVDAIEPIAIPGPHRDALACAQASLEKYISQATDLIAAAATVITSMHCKKNNGNFVVRNRRKRNRCLGTTSNSYKLELLRVIRKARNEMSILGNVIESLETLSCYSLHQDGGVEHAQKIETIFQTKRTIKLDLPGHPQQLVEETYQPQRVSSAATHQPQHAPSAATHQPQQAPSAATQQPQRAQSTEKDDENYEQSNSWVCVLCNVLNPLTEKQCRICATTRIVNVFSQHRQYVRQHLRNCFRCGQTLMLPLDVIKPCCGTYLKTSIRSSNNPEDYACCIDCHSNSLLSSRVPNMSAVKNQSHPTSANRLAEISEEDLTSIQFGRDIDDDSNSAASLSDYVEEYSEHEIESEGGEIVAELNTNEVDDSNVVSEEEVKEPSNVFVSSKEPDINIDLTPSLTNNEEYVEDQYNDIVEEKEDIYRAQIPRHGMGHSRVFINPPPYSLDDGREMDIIENPLDVVEHHYPAEDEEEEPVQSDQQRQVFKSIDGWTCCDFSGSIVPQVMQVRNSSCCSRSDGRSFASQVEHFGIIIHKPTRENVDSTIKYPVQLPICFGASDNVTTTSNSLEIELWWETTVRSDFKEWVDHIEITVLVIVDIVPKANNEVQATDTPPAFREKERSCANLPNNSARTMLIKVPHKHHVPNTGKATATVPLDELSICIEEAAQVLYGTPPGYYGDGAKWFSENGSYKLDTIRVGVQVRVIPNQFGPALYYREEEHRSSMVVKTHMFNASII